MNEKLQQKLTYLPKEPGVYFHKDASGEIIYVGKAAVLRNRVRQYFQKSRTRDPKTDALVSEIVDTDWMVVESELEALFLEAEMIRRYMPRYNILLRDDKALSYIRIDYNSDFPTVSTTRRPLDDGARYFGPYFSNYAIRQALKMLRRIFPFATRRIPGQKRATLHYHLGLDPGLEDGRTSLQDYRANLRKLIAIIEGKRKNVMRELERDMARKAKVQDYEGAAKVRNQLTLLQSLTRQVIFSDKEFLDISKDHALSELVNMLSMEKYPRRIEGYDISHMSGTNVVASMVVFTNGVSDKGNYRKFKTKIDHNNDFYNMHETLSRRLSDKNLKAWGKPSLVLIDGGKGQLDAAIRARDEQAALHDETLRQIPFIGLAKREEQVVIKKPLPAHNHSGHEEASERSGEGWSGVTLNTAAVQKLQGYITESDDFILVNLPHTTNVVKLLQRIRDESHRFAVSYHSVLKQKGQTTSLLDDIPGIGPATRKKILKAFGSLRGIKHATPAELTAVVGAKMAATLQKYLAD